MRSWSTVAPIALVVLAGSVRAEIIYVNAAAEGANNGTTWVDAYISLQPALFRAQSGDQIWVAGGLYHPAGINGNRALSFQLRNGCAMYGGFAGGETSVGQRNWVVNPTILSGDLNENDEPGFVNYGENSLRVVVGSGVGATTILDGFLIEGGNASNSGGEGGGIWLGAFSAPRIANCILRRNRSAGRGGGLFTTQSQPTVLSCSFLENYATNDGGGICNFNGQGTYTNCLIQGNDAGFGGGMFSLGAMTMTRCQLLENSGSGAALYLFNSSSVVTRCLMTGNTASMGTVHIVGQSSRPQPWFVNCAVVQNTGSEAGVLCVYAEPRLTNCTIASNAGTSGPGGVLNHNSQYGSTFITLENCLVWGNTPAPQIGVLQGSTLSVSYSNIQGGYAGTGVFSGDPIFIDPAGGDFRLGPTSSCIDAGDNGVVPGDLSVDLGGRLRHVDDTGMPNRGLAGGIGGEAIIDVGAHEFQGTTCYPNCDNSTSPPLLNVNDFICFQGRFAALDPYSNCDGSTTPPVLNVNDFICFQSAFAAACP